MGGKEKTKKMQSGNEINNERQKGKIQAKKHSNKSTKKKNK
jgi:hypothetical protein